MDYIINGGRALTGTVEIGGAKDAALPIICASIMTDETVTLENIPDITDVNILLDAIKKIGVDVQKADRHTIRINASMIRRYIVNDHNLRKIHSSCYLLGALLGRNKEATVVLPGGEELGSRHFDIHIDGFRKLGATTTIHNGFISLHATVLCGSEVFFDVISTDATINIMMAATMAMGETIIENASKDPCIVDVAAFLNCMGADITGAGTDTIRILGVSSLNGCTHKIIPDRIEAGTFMVAAAATKGDVFVKNVVHTHMKPVTAKLIEIGCEVEETDENTIHIASTTRPHHTFIKAGPYPDFPTNMHPQMGALLALSDGTSLISDDTFYGRYSYAQELIKMGADIRVEGCSAIIDGVTNLFGSTITSPCDIRGSAALVIAALQAEGYSKILDADVILRGYEDFDGKLRTLGAEIIKENLWW